MRVFTTLAACAVAPVLCAGCASDASEPPHGTGGAPAVHVGNGGAAAGSNAAGVGLGGAAATGHAGATGLAGNAGAASPSGGGSGAGGGVGANGGSQSAGASGAAAGGATAPFDPPATPFGNIDLHAQKLGFYMVPDLDAAYRAGGSAPSGVTGKWCAWTKTQATLYRLSKLMPEAWIRWDNETGHNTSSTENVTTFVTCAENAGVGMIVSADAVDGYDTYWANQYVTGVAAPNRSLIDIANGPSLAFAHTLLSQHANVKLVETMNEADGPWFVTDGDNNGSFDYYMSKLVGVMGADKDKIVGPSAAFKHSNLWKNYLARTDLQYFSYHTYSGWNSLEDVPGRKVHVTEYGGFDLNPGAVLDDLWHAEHGGKLSGTIERLYYHQVTDDGDNRGAFNHSATEGDHFAFRDWFRALILYRALARVASRGYAQADAPDFFASDDGKGAFGVLAWNASGGAKPNGSRSIPNVSITPASPLYVVRVLPGDANTAECKALAAQNWVHLSISAHTATLDLVDLPALAAVMISTAACDELAN